MLVVTRSVVIADGAAKVVEHLAIEGEPLHVGPSRLCQPPCHSLQAKKGSLCNARDLVKSLSSCQPCSRLAPAVVEDEDGLPGGPTRGAALQRQASALKVEVRADWRDSLERASREKPPCIFVLCIRGFVLATREWWEAPGAKLDNAVNGSSRAVVGGRAAAPAISRLRLGSGVLRES